MEGKHIVYMLLCNDNSLYTGYTNDLNRRLAMHNSGKGAKYTRGRGPCRVIYQEHFETKELALRREYQIKRLARKKKVELIAQQLKEVDDHADSEELS